MIDTHAHLDFKDFDKDRNEVITSGYNNGVKFIINIGVDLATSKASIKLAEEYDFIYATVGYHPHDSKDLNNDIFNELKELARLSKSSNVPAATIAYDIALGLRFLSNHNYQVARLYAEKGTKDAAEVPIFEWEIEGLKLLLYINIQLYGMTHQIKHQNEVNKVLDKLKNIAQKENLYRLQIEAILVEGLLKKVDYDLKKWHRKFP